MKTSLRMKAKSSRSRTLPSCPLRLKRKNHKAKILLVRKLPQRRREEAETWKLGRTNQVVEKPNLNGEMSAVKDLIDKETRLVVATVVAVELTNNATVDDRINNHVVRLAQ